MRAEQREATRKQIVKAALVEIARAGFDGASTRAIAARANVSQGLLTYHFKSKDALWRAAADHIFMLLRKTVDTALESAEPSGATATRREVVRQLVYFSARHPEFMHFMMDHGKK